MTNSGGFGNETVCNLQIQQISSVPVTLNVQVIEYLLGSYHNVPVTNCQFPQNCFVPIDRELFISIGNSIHLSCEKFVYTINNLRKGHFKFEIVIYCEIRIYRK